MSNWQKVKIGDFLFERKGRYKPNDEQIVNLPRIEKIDFSGNFHIGNKDSKTDMILIKDGDLVISGINVAKGAIGIYSGEDVTATIHYSSYTFDSNKINVEYFKRFLKSSEFIELLNEQVKGGIKTEIKPKHILPLEIQLPDINTQAQIVQHFENVEDDIADVTKEVLKQESLLKKLKQTILQEAIEGKLTAKWRAKNPDIGTAKELLDQIKTEKEKLIKEKKLKASKPLAPINEDEIPFDIPKNWEWCRLGDVITNIKGGGTPSKANSKFWNGNIPWASVKDLKNDFIDFTDDFITEEALNNSSTNLIPKGNIIISTRMGLGKIAFNNIDTCINQDLKAIFLNNINSKYFFSVYKTYSIVGRGMTVDGIRQEDLLSYMFPLPPLEEQKEIVTTIEKLFAICDELESEIKQNKITVQTIMSTVLKEAFEN